MSLEDTVENGEQTLTKPMFRDISADDYDPEITELDSLCMYCHEQGKTRLFMTKIPFFREVILSSFSCDECGYTNAEILPGARIQERGVSFKLTVTSPKDLNRQVVQTTTATVSIPHLDFEIPPSKSALTTIEGVLDRTVEGLEQDQVLRRIQHPEVASQIDAFIEKIKALKDVTEPFTFVIDDPSGNSFLENPLAPSRDLHLITQHYSRTVAQDEQCGIYPAEEGEEGEGEGAPGVVGQDDGEGFNTQNEVMTFRANCNNCQSPCETNMKLVNIPHFKEIIIMATTCDLCGHRDNEVKASGAIEPKGKKMVLTVINPVDIARDVLKSDTASLSIPELDFEAEMGTLGGKFSTVEGLLLDIQNQLKSQNPFFNGDSSQPETNSKLAEFCEKLEDMRTLRTKNYTFIVDDPAGNSYIQSLYSPEPDPQLEETEYERNYQQNEELGLNDMKTENYEHLA